MSFLVASSVFVGFTAVCYFLLGIRMIGGEREVGSIPLGAAFLVIAVWVFGGAVEMMATSETVFTAGRVGHYVGTALVPVFILLCFREITGRSTSRRTVIELLILPSISIVVAATNTWHEFMWYLPATNAAGEFLTRPVEFGPWFKFVHMPYGYAVVATSILTLILHSSAVAPSQRRGLLLLLVLGQAARRPRLGEVDSRAPSRRRRQGAQPLDRLQRRLRVTDRGLRLCQA